MTEFVWIPESPTRPAYYAAKAPICQGKLGEKGIEHRTYSAGLALHFETHDECKKWCEEWNEKQQEQGLTGMFEPKEHGFE